MRTPFRNGLHVALNSPRVFGLAAIALLLEALVRFVLAVTVHPVVAVVWPPVVALPLLGAGAPAVEDCLDRPAEQPALNLESRLRTVGPGLLVAAVVGHLVALVGGAAAFLVLDTAVRFVVYTLGGTIPPGVVIFLPLPGVAAGTLIAWGVLVPAIEHLVAGESLRTAAGEPLRTLADRRRTVGVLSMHGGVVSVAAVVFGLCLALAAGRYSTQEAVLFGLGAATAVLAGVLVLIGIFVYPIHVGLATTSADRRSSIPVGRVALAGLLVSGLVVGAGVVRVTETRPLPADTAATPLPADGTAAYGTAVERTSATDHRLTMIHEDSDERTRFSLAVERSSRQVWFSIRSPDRSRTGYTDSGVIYVLGVNSPDLYTLSERRIDNNIARSQPGYWGFDTEYSITGNGGFGLPDPQTGDWETVAEENGTRTLELTDDTAVFDAIVRSDVETASAETAWIRMRVDEARGVVLGGRLRVNGTFTRSREGSYPPTRLDRAYNYTVETGPAVDARRPSVLGSRSLSEWTWDLFAY